MFSIDATDDEAAARAALTPAMARASAREAAVTVLLEILGYDARSPLDPAGKRRLIVSLLQESLRQRSEASPVVVLIEDLHWRDASSSDVLAEVSRAVSPLRCLFLSTAREASDIAWPAEAVALEALPPDAAADLIDRLAPVPLDDPTKALILERTAGNPFFIEEVVRSLRPGRELTVPATVQDLLEARLDTLALSPRRVAQGAAVIGRTFWRRILERVTPDEDLDPALATLEQEHFVSRVPTAEPAYAFPHALVQEVAYRTQLIAHRRRSHVVVGDAYTELFPGRTDEFVDTLAFHYRRGDDDPKALTWLMRAGRRAQHLYANVEALDYFHGCLERAGVDAAARADAFEAIGDVQRVIGKYDEALSAYADALVERADEAIVERARLRRKTGIVHQLHGEMAVALSMFEDSLAQLPADAAGERARALLSIGQVRWRQGRYDEAVTILERAQASASDASDDDALAEVLKQLGSVLLLKGDIARAVREYQRSLALYEALGDVLGQANSLNNIGAAFRRQSRLVEALEAYERSLAIRERIGDQLGITHSRNNLGEVHFLRGDLEQAERNFSAAVTVAEAIRYVGLARVGLGATRVERGDSETGRRDLLTAVRELESASNQTYLADALRDLAQAFLPDQLDAALEWAERAVSVARGLGSDEKIGAALTVLGRVRLARGDETGAIAVLEQALDILERVAERQEAARAMAALAQAYGRVAADDPRRSAAKDLSSRARTIFIELGAALDLRHLDAALGAVT
jgi:tetratricopeptide (TPR) repeat protein